MTAMKPVVAAAALVAVSVGVMVAVPRSASTCDHLTTLLASAGTDFDDIEGADLTTDGRPHEWLATFVLDDADMCTITRDPERSGYLCDWQFPRSSAESSEFFGDLVDDVRACVGDTMDEREDALVNHPDFFGSTYFVSDTREVSVSLKDKVGRDLTIVTLGVDRR